MSTKFRHRLRRLHDAHVRGREGTSGPSGVYEADGVVERRPKERKAEVRERPSERAGAERGGAKESRWGQLGAVERTNGAGAYFELSETVGFKDVHGKWGMEAARAVYEGDLGRMLKRASLPLGTGVDELLFMDTETTGLGEEAYAFMVGVGYWSAGGFEVRHLVIEGPEQERAMLGAFEAMLGARPVLVTFNGKSFDLPLLNRRMGAQGLKELEPAGHLDLLHLARKSFQGRKRYRLSSLEEDLLGFARVGDVPGRKIPGEWRRFQKGASTLMGKVVEHNRHDIVSMATLLAEIVAPGEAGGSVGGRSRSQSRGSRGSRGGRSRSRGGREKAAISARRGSSLKAQLERSYRLRDSFREERSEGGRGGEAGEPGAWAMRRRGGAGEGEESGAERELEEYARRLKAGAQELLRAELWEQAQAVLAELVAIRPDDRFGLQKLARCYRRRGDEALAQALEERLRG